MAKSLGGFSEAVGDWRSTDYGLAQRNFAATASSMLVSTLDALLRSNSARISAARIGVSPHVMKMISAASRFFAVHGVSFPPPLVAMNAIRTVPFGCKSARSLPGILVM
jgi:hypothetical protein